MIEKSNKYTIIIVVLAVLLVISLVAGTTFAWFASTQSQTKTITLGDPVRLTIVDEEGNDVNSAGKKLPITIPGTAILPGMKIEVLARSVFDKSNTPALLRAKVSIVVQDVATSDPDELQEVADINAMLEDIINGTETTDALVDKDAPGAKWVYFKSDLDNGWWYYTGSSLPNSTANLNVMQRIDCSSATDADRTITFIDDWFVFPKNAGNVISNSNVQFTVTFQALQGYLPAISGDDTQNEVINLITYRINTIKNVYELFYDAFAS